ncbi:MAG: flagellar hook-associated protein FlgK, partial [Planctomycetes bacterium]|nr:flagellar hook-associated protein FlgK [Planctomycetota bacterium]
MSGYDIAISGINAAMRAFDVIGNNIANASTEGYHRQEIQLTPAYGTQYSNITIGGGVNAGDVMRKIDNLLEQEILRQNSSLEQFYRQVLTMKTIENAFGEISSENGLNASIDAFFGSLSELSAYGDENSVIYQNKVVSCARVMTGQFNTLGRYLDTLENQIELEASNTVENANILINQIAELNNNIERLESQGNSASNLKDQRDQYISELSTYIGVSTIARDWGVVDVSVAGITVVAGSRVTEISIGLTVGGQFGIGVAGTANYTTNNINGGTIGAYISLKNETIADIRSDLNDLAGAIINQVNQYHVQGVAASGSFTQLSGSLILDEDLTTFDPPVTDGSFFIRVTDTET